MSSFKIEVHKNGIVYIPLGFGEGQDSTVYEMDSLETFLTEVYRKCTGDWNHKVQLVESK